MSFQLKSVFFTSVPNSTNHTRWHTLDDWYMSMIDFSQVHPKKVCMYLFRYAAYKDILEMPETQFPLPSTPKPK